MAELFGITRGIILQQVNCQGIYGAGLSGAIAQLYPVVYERFNKFNELNPTPEQRLGKSVLVALNTGNIANDILAVGNLYTQFNYGNSVRTGIKYTNTALLIICIYKICKSLPDLPVYVPHHIDENGNHTGIGCGLAGEKWEVLYPLLQELNVPNLYLLDTYTGETTKIETIV